MPKKKLLTVKEYAKLYKVTPRTVYRRIKHGIIQIEQPKPHYPIRIIL